MTEMLQFYVVENLLSGKLDISHFRRLPDAVQAYKALPTYNRKALGVLHGDEAVDLVQCLALVPNDQDGEDVLVLKFLEFPLWKSDPQFMETAQELAIQLNTRYCLYQGCIIPAPDRETLPRALRGKYLWPGVPGEFYSAVHWIYVAGVGRLSPAEFNRRYAHNGDFIHPLIIRIGACGVDQRGNYTPLDVSPWEFHLLIQRSQERIDQNKSEKRNLQ